MIAFATPECQEVYWRCLQRRTNATRWDVEQGGWQRRRKKKDLSEKMKREVEIVLVVLMVAETVVEAEIETEAAGKRAMRMQRRRAGWSRRA